MGNMITWMIGIPLIGWGIYLFMRSMRKEMKGDCCGCSGCSEQSCSFKKE